ncbi:MAG: hypothetical protein EXX96DRAFT_617143 [Benjaminiella poitrasii]|nr:MAG: hypothetical protein EXX96DRAFT_617143 [Benjaminiella poitrasii]
MYVDQDIRDEFLDYFPTLMDKKIYYKYAEQVNVVMTKEKQGRSEMMNNCSTKWKLPLATLKRLDQVEYDWKKDIMSFNDELPNLTLEPLFLLSLEESIQIDTWYWQDKSKSFPLIQLTAHTNSKPKQTDAVVHQEKIRIDSKVIDRLTLFDPQQQKQEEELSKLSQLYGIQLEFNNSNANHPTSMPQRDISYFQSLHKTSSFNQKPMPTGRRCELDFARFNFD